MAKARARYTLEFEREAVRLVEGDQSIAAAARTLGVVEQPLFNWVKAQRAGKLGGVDGGRSAPSRWRSAGCAPS